MTSRRPIEPMLRDEDPPDEAAAVIRAGPVTAEKIVEHANRELARFTYRGEPLAAISVDVTVGGWDVDRILRERLWSRSRYALAAAGDLRAADYELLPTANRPHYSLVLPSATFEDAVALLAHFGPTIENEYRRRR